MYLSHKHVEIVVATEVVVPAGSAGLQERDRDVRFLVS